MIPRLISPAIALVSFGAALGLATRHASVAPATTPAPALAVLAPAPIPLPALVLPAPVAEDPQPAAPIPQREVFQDAPERGVAHGSRSH